MHLIAAILDTLPGVVSIRQAVFLLVWVWGGCSLGKCPQFWLMSFRKDVDRLEGLQKVAVTVAQL